MRSGRPISVRSRLTLSFFAVILLSWALSSVGFVSVRHFFKPGGAGGHQRPGPVVFPAPIAPPPAPPAGPGVPPPPPWGLRLLRQVMLPAHLLMALLISVAAGAWLSRHVVRSLAALAAGAAAFQEGRLDYRIPAGRPDEFARVAATMNGMAESLEHHITALREDALRRQQLLADMAHELRSPVATLKMMAGALQDGLADEPTRRQRALEATTRSIERLEKLVNDMIVIARLDLQQLPLERCELDVREVARSCIEILRPRAEEAGVSLLPLAAGGPVWVSADPVRLAQVFDNLVGNAVSHAGRGAQVTVSVEPGPPVTVVIQDTGRGIAAEHMPFLFDPFYRVDASRSPSDHHAGLGLRIARGLVEAHGGTLDLESELGHGTTVTVTLPATEA